MSVITLTTDFGSGSPYVATMKGVILAINPAATVVDLTHDIRPQDVRQGALILEDVTQWFPADTIHVVVVDPGVGTDRAICYARMGPQCYVAPDNGLLSRVARRQSPSMLIRLTEPAYWLQPVSATFHSRDIMAPVAAHLSLGLPPTRLGRPLERLADLDWPEPCRQPGRIDSQILMIDSFGNLVTNVTVDLLGDFLHDKRTEVTIQGRSIAGISQTYGDHPAGTLVALVGSRGRLEVAIVGGNAAAKLRAGVGTPVTITAAFTA